MLSSTQMQVSVPAPAGTAAQPAGPQAEISQCSRCSLWIKIKVWCTTRQHSRAVPKLVFLCQLTAKKIFPPEQSAGVL